MKRIVITMIIGSLFFFTTASGGQPNPQAISAVQFEALGVDTSTGANHLNLTLKARKAGKFEGIIDTRQAAQKSLEYFFTGLAVPDEAFWVNLNPNEPFRIIDQLLGPTDLGGVMLKADLRLKEDACGLLDPQSSEIGREFWKKLRKEALRLGVGNKIYFTTRLWIVPDEVLAIETKDRFSIIKSNLQVSLEPAYLSPGVAHKQLQDFAAGLMQELILPYLNKKVNQDYAHSDLREVYHALILARWYKEKFGPSYGSLVAANSLDLLEDAEVNPSSAPQQIYSDYLESFYSLSASARYFSGGINFKDIPVTFMNDQNYREKEEDFLFTCDLFVPRGVQRPLQYAKNHMELTFGNSSGDKNTVIWASNLPEIAPVNFSEQRIQGLDSAGKIERIALSRL